MTNLATKFVHTRLLGSALIIAIWLLTASVSLAQTFTTLASFDATNGSPWYTSLVQGRDGNLYGTTSGTQGNGPGTVFKITPEGTLTTLYTFCAQAGCTDGEDPNGGLLLATDGDFYGLTTGGGANNGGTVFKITPTGTLTTLYSFCAQTDCADGMSPTTGLVQGTNGNFYGTTLNGGHRTCPTFGGCGTVFEITPAGVLTTLHKFSWFAWTDGANPLSPPTQGPDGNFYGTTLQGGAYRVGTVFSMTPAGKLTVLHSFGGFDGDSPGGLVLSPDDGNFYGTTQQGGAGYDGTIFQITPGGALTTLVNFDGGNGNAPLAGLVLGTDGNFYGTTSSGGANSEGTVFEVTPQGTLTTLHSFDGTDGSQPHSGLMQADDGNFYGLSWIGGANNDGTVYSLSTGLGPFVTTDPTFGSVGKVVGILGNNLTGTTSVTFNGTPATFTVVSSTLIKATVPSGATTGTIEVTTPSSTLFSNTPFQVLP